MAIQNLVKREASLERDCVQRTSRSTSESCVRLGMVNYVFENHTSHDSHSSHWSRALALRQ